MITPIKSMNMKTQRNLMLVCLLLAASISYAQSETIVVGKKIDGTDLKAQCYTFPQRVETFSMSDKGDYLCISFRETTKSGKYLKNKGEIGFYDTKSSQLLWKQPIDFSKSKITPYLHPNWEITFNLSFGRSLNIRNWQQDIIAQ